MDAAQLARCLPIWLLAFPLGCGFDRQEASPFIADESRQSLLYDQSRSALESPVQARSQGPVEPPVLGSNPPTLPPVTPITQTSGVQQQDPPAVPLAGTPQVKVVAIIGADGVVTDDEVWMRVRQRSGEFANLKGPERAAKEKAVFEESLRQLIERELIIADFLGKIRKNKPQLLDELRTEAKSSARKNVKAMLKDLQVQNNIGTEAELIEIMNHLPGMSLPLIQRSHERQALVDIYIQQFVKDKGKHVSLAEVTRFYAENQQFFRIEDRVKWQDLFVSYRRFNTPDEAQQYAEQLHKQLTSGSDFVQMVKQFGHGDSVLRDGDGIGSKRGEIQPRELEETVFQLKPEQLSPIIPTETGLHIVRVLERDIAGLRPLDEKAQQMIKNKILNDMREAEIKKLIEELWRKITVRVIE